MSRHRAEPPGRRPPTEIRHRASAVRPRYGRLAIAGTAVSVTAIALLGGVGVLPSVASGKSNHPSSSAAKIAGPLRLAATTARSADPRPEAPSPSISLSPTPNESAAANPTATASTSGTSQTATPEAPPAVPADSGSGKRVVFSQGQQRVWLVGDDGKVVDTYLVSGSRYHNLQPGPYRVYSRSEDAVGVDDSGTMKYFVRFAHGPTGAAIGFHDIPIFDGKLVQSRAQLGTPESHGCVRQYRPDAIELWNFAPIGTEVDVTA